MNSGIVNDSYIVRTGGAGAMNYIRYYIPLNAFTNLFDRHCDVIVCYD